jgi:membrane-associated phospholipid phosphatase
MFHVRSFERLSLVYFVAMVVLAWVRPLPAARRVQISAIGVVICAAIWLAAIGGPFARDWALPGAIILGAYYQSGRFFVQPSPRFERWLNTWDRRLLGDPAARFARWPRPLRAYLDIVYMGCFLLVPAGFAALVASGLSSQADRYWTMVIGSELASFVSLAFVQSRPPWAIERAPIREEGVARSVHRVADRMVRHLLIGANTFPSGHVAGSLAVALALLGPLPSVGVPLLLLALSIAVACVAGRYHYVMDAVAGASVALVIWGLVDSTACLRFAG